MHSPRKVKPIVSSYKKGTAPEKNNKQTSVWSHKKGTVPENQIVSSHKTGTAPSQADCSVISQERDRSFKEKSCCVISQTKGPFLKTDKDPNQNCRNRSQKCEWISGTLSQHVAWLCDSRFLSQEVLYHPKRGQAVLSKDLETFFLLPWRLDPSCTMGDDPRQARSCSSEFCP